jgi:hypothetical protein
MKSVSIIHLLQWSGWPDLEKRVRIMLSRSSVGASQMLAYKVRPHPTADSLHMIRNST